MRGTKEKGEGQRASGTHQASTRNESLQAAAPEQWHWVQPASALALQFAENGGKETTNKVEEGGRGKHAGHVTFHQGRSRITAATSL